MHCMTCSLRMNGPDPDCAWHGKHAQEIKLNTKPEAVVPYELANAPASHQSEALTAREDKNRIAKMLGEARFYVIDPQKVNYTETK